jgi:type IV pilus modification protein PilV
MNPSPPAVPAKAAPSSAYGFSLIEVLIALVVLNIGLLGLSALYIESLRLNRTAIHRNAAIGVVSDIAERLRAEGHAAATGTIELAALTEFPTQLPEPSTLNIRSVPRGENGLVHDTTLERYDVELQWPETGHDVVNTYSLTVYLPGQ